MSTFKILSLLLLPLLYLAGCVPTTNQTPNQTQAIAEPRDTIIEISSGFLKNTTYVHRQDEWEVVLTDRNYTPTKSYKLRKFEIECRLDEGRVIVWTDQVISHRIISIKYYQKGKIFNDQDISKGKIMTEEGSVSIYDEERYHTEQLANGVLVKTVSSNGGRFAAVGPYIDFSPAWAVIKTDKGIIKICDRYESPIRSSSYHEFYVEYGPVIKQQTYRTLRRYFAGTTLKEITSDTERIDF
jgi:hypothetical protein